MYGPLPGLRPAWSAYAGSDAFVSYNVYRRRRRSILDDHTTVAMVTSGAETLIQRADLFDGVQGWIAIRGSFPWNNASEPGGGTGTPGVIYFLDTANGNYLWAFYNEATNAYRFSRKVGGTTVNVDIAAAVVTSAKFTLIVAWTAAGFAMSLNGAPLVTGTLAGIDLTADLVDVGSNQGFNPSSIAVSWLVTGTGTLANADVMWLASLADDAFGDYPPTLEPLRQLSDAAIPTGLWANLEANAYKLIVEPWSNVATITDVARTHYMDRRTFSGQIYEYAVTVSANVFGDVLETDKQVPPVAGVETHEQMAFHNARDESEYVRVSGRAFRVQPEQDLVFVEARGRNQKTAQLGELDDSRIHIEPQPQDIGDSEAWDLLRRMLTAQRAEAAVFMVRPGQQSEGFYVAISQLQRDDVPVQTNIGLDLQEVYFDESSD